MTDVRPRAIAERQAGVVARWQLVRAGMSEAGAEHWAHDLRALHDGVYLTGWSAPTERQLRWAAVLSAPGTVLSHASAAALWGIRAMVGSVQTVTRVGARGREHPAGLLVSYSLTLAGSITQHEGIPVTTIERTIIDLWPHLDVRARSRLLREALRMKLTTAPRMHAAIRRHRGRRGVATLRLEVEALGVLALDRCRSDAEAWAVALIAEAGRPMPVVNEEIAGEEADLTWKRERLIVELDGPRFHVLRDADVRKQRVWEAAGFTVRRLPSGVVYCDSAQLLALVPPNVASPRP